MVNLPVMGIEEIRVKSVSELILGSGQVEVSPVVNLHVMGIEEVRGTQCLSEWAEVSL